MASFSILSANENVSSILRKVRIPAFLSALLFTGWPLNAQTFPLKTNESHLLTKKQIPFLINGRTADVYQDFATEFYNLQRYGNLGINTAFVTLPQTNIALTSKGKLDKDSRKQVRNLRKFSREAALYNIAIFVSTNTDSIMSPEIRNKYLDFVFQKMAGARNVSWIINNIDIQSEAITLINKNQLKATETGIEADFHIVYSPTVSPVSKPFIYQLKAGSLQSAGIIDSLRHSAYTTMMNGASGIIAAYCTQSKATLYNPVSQQLRQLKNTLDSLPWSQFRKFPQIISRTDSGNQQIDAAITRDSTIAAVYLRQYQTLSLNLSSFKTMLKFSWINPVTGKLIETSVLPDPQIQLFLPPYNDGKTSDWLLLITTFPEKHQ
jgi:uncharacterized protein with HEPN domain